MTFLVITIFSFVTFIIVLLYKDTKLKKAYHLPVLSNRPIEIYGLQFRKASIYDIDLIRNLALQIWPQTFENLVTPQQLITMLNRKFSKSSLVNQINHQHEFYIIYNQDKAVGFFSISMDEKVCRLHKLYIIPGFQGSGIGMEALRLILNLCNKNQQTKLVLSIHKNNEAIAFYEKAGFIITGVQKRQVDKDSFITEWQMEMPLKRKQIKRPTNKGFMRLSQAS
jgi:ribosomal protein S18 acetylase RimI-like enzyme